MRNVTVAVVQMQCAKEVEANIAKADAMVRGGSGKGGQDHPAAGTVRAALFLSGTAV